MSILRGEVFFVRHNDGAVWFDKLGKPWEKHSCFLSLPEPVGLSETDSYCLERIRWVGHYHFLDDAGEKLEHEPCFEIHLGFAWLVYFKVDLAEVLKWKGRQCYFSNQTRRLVFLNGKSVDLFRHP